MNFVRQHEFNWCIYIYTFFKLKTNNSDVMAEDVSYIPELRVVIQIWIECAYATIVVRCVATARALGLVKNKQINALSIVWTYDSMRVLYQLADVYRFVGRYVLSPMTNSDAIQLNEYKMRVNDEVCCVPRKACIRLHCCSSHKYDIHISTSHN